jgi:hypothetical protein
MKALGDFKERFKASQQTAAAAAEKAGAAA